MGSARDALKYAEDTLGVHKCYDEANEALAELDDVLGDLDKAHDTKRQLTDAIEARNLELLSSEWSKHPDHSAAKMDQHMKLVRHRDAALREYQRKLSQTNAELQGLDYDAEIIRTRIKIATARIAELGGYLQYLAAVKLGTLNTTPATPTTTP